MKMENQLEIIPKQGRKKLKDQTRRLQAYQKRLSVISGDAKKKK